MKDKLLVAVIGYGGMGALHAETYGIRDDVTLVAAVDPREEARDKFTTIYPGAQAFANLDSMLDDVIPDAVSICAPNCYHALLAIRCLKAGINVLCEKPPATSTAECLDMLTAAEKSDKVLRFQLNNRHRPEAQYLMTKANSGFFGDMRCIHAGWRRRFGVPGRGSWFTIEEESGGGAMIDLGVHMLDLALYLSGYPEPIKVMCTMASDFGPENKHNGPWGTPDPNGKFNVEDSAHAMVTFTNGQVIVIEASWAEHIPCEHVYLEMAGKNGGVLFDRYFGIEGIDSTSQDRLIMYSDDEGYPVDMKVGIPPDPTMGRVTSINNFVDCLVGDSEPSDPKEALKLMQILAACYKSANTGEAIDPLSV